MMKIIQQKMVSTVLVFGTRMKGTVYVYYSIQDIVHGCQQGLINNIHHTVETILRRYNLLGWLIFFIPNQFNTMPRMSSERDSIISIKKSVSALDDNTGLVESRRHVYRQMNVLSRFYQLKYRIYHLGSPRIIVVLGNRRTYWWCGISMYTWTIHRHHIRIVSFHLHQLLVPWHAPNTRQPKIYRIIRYRRWFSGNEACSDIKQLYYYCYDIPQIPRQSKIYVGSFRAVDDYCMLPMLKINHRAIIISEVRLAAGHSIVKVEQYVSSPLI